MRMELRVLKYFLAVAREENITRAAEQLHVSQPAVSRQIAQLEEELGIRAFERKGKRVTLTEEGRLLRRRAQEMLDLAEKTARDFRQEPHQLTGEIAIGSGELMGFSQFAELLGRFAGEHPGVRYTLFSAGADLIRERIDNGTLDLGIFSLPAELERYDFLKFPSEEEFGILTPEDGALANKQAIAPEDLVDVPLILPERTLVQRELARWFGDSYHRLRVTATYNLLYNAAILVQKGMGAALCLRLECNYEGLKFVPLAPPSLELGAALAWKKQQAYPPAVSALIDFARLKNNFLL